MSDNIPLEIQVEIMKRLPIKSLIQFRSVSKSWKSLIDSSKFIADYQRTQLPQHLLVRDEIQYNYVSIADDDTFPQQKVSLTIPMSVRPAIVGCSQGLFCIYDLYVKPSDSGTNTAVIWNPTIRKSVAIDMPSVLDRKKKHTTNLGFGVCPRTLDPMLVKIIFEYCSEEIYAITDTTWEVEVFRLSSGVWKSLSINLPQRSTGLRHNQVAIGRFIYWVTSDRFCGSDMILSFDILSEEFTEICLPDNLALQLQPDLDVETEIHIYELKESLAVFQFELYVEVSDIDVWIMENSDPKSFEKIYTIKGNIPPNASILGVVGSRKSGELLVEVTKGRSLEEEEQEEEEEDDEDSKIAVYDPNSERIDYIGISARRDSFFVSSYTETLLLLDH